MEKVVFKKIEQNQIEYFKRAYSLSLKKCMKKEKVMILPNVSDTIMNCMILQERYVIKLLKTIPFDEKIL